MTRRVLTLALAFACAALPVHAQKPKKTKADITKAEKKMLEAATRAKTTGCGKTIPGHVYKPERLKIYSNCIAVTGTIVDATAPQSTHRTDGVRKEGDGDTHGWLKLDREWKGLLNTGNMTDEDGNLVFEIVCFFSVSQTNAKKSCPKSYQNQITLPPVGSRVEMRGAFVRDENHQHWMEIHPVAKIKVIP
jgi:hypothetical protein